MDRVLKLLVEVKAPLIVLQVVALVMMNVGSLPIDLDCIEYFAGDMAASRIDCLRDVDRAPNETTKYCDIN